MRLIPSIIHRNCTDSERRAFQALEKINLGPNAVAIHSLNLADHEYKKWGEIDFILLSPLGLMVMEIKGGAVSCKNGVWKYSNSRGKSFTRRESPHSQAKGNYYSLLNNYLLPVLDHDIDNINSGFCVVFTDITKKQLQVENSPPELPEKITCFHDQFIEINTFENFIRAAYQYWNSKSRTKNVTMTEKFIEEIIGILRPELDLVPPLRVLWKKNEEQLIKLTREQSIYLEIAEQSDRLILEGGAGTGKTFLALEIARIEANKKHTTCFYARDSSFANYVRSIGLPDEVKIIDENELKTLSATGKPAFDCLIVDEGQDSCTPPFIKLLSSIVKGGLKEGHWYWLSDINNQIIYKNSFLSQSYEDLCKLANHRLKIKRNCRNTPQLVEDIQSVTGADLGQVETKGFGKNVERIIEKDTNLLIEKLSKVLRHWLESEEILPHRICLLSPLSLEQSIAKKLAAVTGMQIEDISLSGKNSAEKGKIGFSNIKSFKGREADAVILLDLWDLSHLEALKVYYYIGVSRAKLHAVVACTPQLVDMITHLVQNTALLAIENMGKSHE